MWFLIQFVSEKKFVFACHVSWMQQIKMSWRLSYGIGQKSNGSSPTVYRLWYITTEITWNTVWGAFKETSLRLPQALKTLGSVGCLCVSQPWVQHSHMGENLHIVQLCMPAWAHSLLTAARWNSIAHPRIFKVLSQPWWAPFWKMGPMRRRLPTVGWLGHCFTFQRRLWALPHLGISHYTWVLSWVTQSCSRFLQAIIHIPIAELYLR